MGGLDWKERERDIDSLLKEAPKVAPVRYEDFVLVADDDMSIRRILVLFLTAAGYKCIEANNGRQVLDLCKRHGIKALLLDVMMPIMDGLTACRMLKSDPATQHIPIVLCTAMRKKDSVLEALQAGADDYIVKPFKREIVLQKLAKALAKKAATVLRAASPSVERRKAPRKKVSFQLSWSPPSRSTQIVYKTRVVNICSHGLCFELDACEDCKGYCSGTVHEKCQMFPFAFANERSADIEMILTSQGNGACQVRGKVIHIYRPPHSSTECVGVFFTHVPPDAAKHIREVAGC